MSAILHRLPHVPTSEPPRRRRVSRARETNRDVVLRAVPDGCVRAAHGDQVRRALADTPEYARSYRRARVTIRKTLDALIQRADYETMTSRPGWEALAESVGVSRRTIARALAHLRAWGLLGIVASGRTAAYASRGPDGERTNEAAVYVLCIPSPLTIVPAHPESSVDRFGTPPAQGGSHLKDLKKTPTRAREKTSSGAATPPENIMGGSAAPESFSAYRPELTWPAHRTTKTPRQRLAAACELRHRIFLLRPMSPKDIRSVIRDFLHCGWTVADLHHALDFLPSGQPWPYAGIPDTTSAPRLRGWLRHRLNAWRTTTGEPLRSRDQHLHGEALQRQAAARKATEAAAARQQELNKRTRHAVENGQPAPNPSWRIRFAEQYEQGLLEGRRSKDTPPPPGHNLK